MVDRVKYMNGFKKIIDVFIVASFLVSGICLHAMDVDRDGRNVVRNARSRRSGEDDRKVEVEREEVRGQLSKELLKAAETGDVAVIKKALKNDGLDVDAVSETGGTLLSRAAAKGQTSVMALLLEYKAEVDVR